MTTKASDTQVGGDHYRAMGDFQPWDVLQHWLTPEEYRGYQKGVAIAYLARERQKGADQDIKKAAHHLQRLLEALDEFPVSTDAAAEAGASNMADPQTIMPCCGDFENCTTPCVPRVIMTQADKDGWIEWHGGECPVPGDVVVEIRNKDLEWSRGQARDFMWPHIKDDSADITSYRIVLTHPAQLAPEQRP